MATERIRVCSVLRQIKKQKTYNTTVQTNCPGDCLVEFFIGAINKNYLYEEMTAPFLLETLSKGEPRSRSMSMSMSSVWLCRSS